MTITICSWRRRIWNPLDLSYPIWRSPSRRQIWTASLSSSCRRVLPAATRTTRRRIALRCAWTWPPRSRNEPEHRCCSTGIRQPSFAKVSSRRREDYPEPLLSFLPGVASNRRRTRRSSRRSGRARRTLNRSPSMARNKRVRSNWRLVPREASPPLPRPRLTYPRLIRKSRTWRTGHPPRASLDPSIFPVCPWASVQLSWAR